MGLICTYGSGSRLGTEKGQGKVVAAFHPGCRASRFIVTGGQTREQTRMNCQIKRLRGVTDHAPPDLLRFVPSPRYLLSTVHPLRRPPADKTASSPTIIPKDKRVLRRVPMRARAQLRRTSYARRGEDPVDGPCTYPRRPRMLHGKRGTLRSYWRKFASRVPTYGRPLQGAVS